jgi:ABC-type Fe3+ transport system substrate-binding protein
VSQPLETFLATLLTNKNSLNFPTFISPINLFLTGPAPDRAQEFRNWATTAENQKSKIKNFTFAAIV